MAAGCASVVSNIGAHRELIRSGENGLIYESVDDLAGKIDFLVGDPTARVRLGREARKSALNFSWGRAAREMLDLYTRLSVRGGLG
jgi:glycosyltransferase involved in cell wall biosynthesis